MAEREGFPTDGRRYHNNPVKQGIPEKAGEGLRPPLCTTGVPFAAVKVSRFGGILGQPTPRAPAYSHPFIRTVDLRPNRS